MRSTLLPLLVTFAAVVAAPAASPPHAIMPAPAEWRAGDGRLAVDARFTVFFAGDFDARLETGVARALRRWEARTGLTFARPLALTPTAATLIIECARAGGALPALGDDESYSLDVTSARVTLRAPAVVGVLRGLETLLQLLASDAQGFHLAAVSIKDAPRFPWRGLMLDVCRHWQPMAVVKRTLDGMALVKLNVLHLHLTEDQGFRIESKRFPRLHELGSDGDYFTQDEMREIIAYAAARGIRVVPEFDLPGHATSWVVGHPELASQPGPYVIERQWGVFDPTLDPTNERTYELLDGFFGEMAALFPDPYLHIGGDENNGRHWDANPRIQAFKREHNLKDNEALQAHFNRRVLAILAKYQKRMIGWDEIFHPDLPKDAVIHSWRGYDSLAAAARQGYTGILSNGYYIDLLHPTTDHYLNDPLPAGTTLTGDEQRGILGGEATMWSEWVTPETIDSRIWPRTAAIAERLWSPQDVRDVPDMYRRLDVVSHRLEEHGLSLTRHVDFMLHRLAGDATTATDQQHLRTLVDLVEPVKGYQRGQQQPGTTQFTPLTGFVDAARADSAVARTFAAVVHQQLFSAGPADWSELRAMLLAWTFATSQVRQNVYPVSPRIRALDPLFQRIAAASEVGRDACHWLENAQPPPAGWRDEAFARLDAATMPHDACELPIIPALRRLVAAASAKAERATLSPEAWRKRVETLAAPAAAVSAAGGH